MTSLWHRVRLILPPKINRQFLPFMCFNNYSYNKHDSTRNLNAKTLQTVAAVGVATATVIYYKLMRETNAASAANIKIYSLNEVSKHTDKKQGVWVTYKGHVYDITNFVDQHPGGKKIMLAAGGSLEPFWALYGMHNSPAVRELLEEYKIGDLSEEDALSADIKVLDDPFANDPRRHPALRPASIKPYNAEPPPALLVDSYTTPNDLFYVRNHMPVPDVNLKNFRLALTDMNSNTIHLSLEDLKKFPKVTITAAIQCAGNRRSEMSQVKAVKGLSWGHAAIGNATWSGARLTDVLQHHGLEDDMKKAQHVHFQGLDAGLDGISYAASVPATAALDPSRDVILAYEMNGEPLPRDHGGPLRVIVPGVVGARNVKWLGGVVLCDKESDSHWQQNDYKGLPPGADWDSADFSKAPAIQELPVQSAICVPEDGETVQIIDGAVTVRGYAWSGGGRKIVRVDVSADCGKTWHEAEVEPNHAAVQQPQWAWSLWNIQLPVSASSEKVELWVKAVDSSYNVQPESFAHIWNFRGVLSNAYHKITVELQH